MKCVSEPVSNYFDFSDKSKEVIIRWCGCGMMDGPVVVLKHGVIFEAGFWRDFGREVDRHLFAELLNAALTGERLMAQKYHTCDVEDPNYPSKFLEVITLHSQSCELIWCFF